MNNNDQKFIEGLVSTIATSIVVIVVAWLICLTVVKVSEVQTGQKIEQK